MKYHDRNDHTELALNRLLVKLKLIPKEGLPPEQRAIACGQIEFFAHAGMYDEWQAIGTIAKELGIRFVKIDAEHERSINALLDQAPLSKVEPTRWKEMRAVPAVLTDSSLLLVMANPLDHEVKMALEFELDRRIEVAIGREKEILELLDVKINYGDAYNLEAILKNTEPMKISEHAVETSREHAYAESSVEKDDPTAAPVVRLVNKIFHDAVNCGASDIHVTPEKNELIVKARVDGIIRNMFTIPNDMKKAVVSRIKLLSNMDIAEKRLPQDGRMRLKTGHGNKDVRISTVPATYGENLVARILSPEFAKVNFDSLGMTETLTSRLKDALSCSSKVHLVTGPTGSGKTSTLYASLMHLRDGKSNIITLEDPIEYRISGVTQIQVNPKIGLSFAAGLKSILRQDPDTILVGEIRDPETATIAMQTAQTGHLVLSTLHTNSAAAAITRLKDLDIAPYLISSCLGSVMAQRLVRRLCEHCATPVDDEYKARCVKLGLNPELLKQPGVCEACDNTGFKGRVGVFSFLFATEAVCEAIHDDLGEDEIEQRAREDGYTSLWEAANELISAGVTSLDEAERVLGLRHGESKKSRTPTAHDTPQTADETQQTAQAGVITKKKILLVEDDRDTGAVLKAIFEREMYDVALAVNGDEGLKSVYDNPPDLIVSDVMMPKMNGLDMLKKLKANPQTKDLPVLMLTANVTEENELDLMQIGADDFVSKATNPQILLARINRLLRG